ncbi:unnamed protein product [Linum trigynum]|uniref:Uncharacterized protein n=1 Tax=Linum trigynum TaxID=586398 RepID=A0AAV2D9X5_9ROSI
MNREAGVRNREEDESIPNGVNSTPSSLLRVLIRNPSLLARKAHNRCRKFSSVIATLDSRWSAKRMEFAAGVIVEALKQGKALNGEGMSW